MTATGVDLGRRPMALKSRRKKLFVAQRSLRDRRRNLVVWALSIGAYVGAIVAVWPSIRGSSSMSEAIANYPEAMKELFGGAENFDYSTPSGYLNVQLFSLMAPLLLSAFAIGYGASILAGEEEGGQLALTLSTPVSRRRVVLEKAGGVFAAVIGLSLCAFVTIVAIGAAVDLNVGVRRVVAACTGATLVALVHGSLTLAVGAATGKRSGNRCRFGRLRGGLPPPGAQRPCRRAQTGPGGIRPVLGQRFGADPARLPGARGSDSHCCRPRTCRRRNDAVRAARYRSLTHPLERHGWRVTL